MFLTSIVCSACATGFFLDSMTKELIKMRLVHAYPELIESRKKPVAQAEHTIEVRPSGTVVLT